MASTGMLRRVALARTDGSDELSASFIRVIKIGEIRNNASCNQQPTHTAIVFLRSALRLLVTASVVPISPILVTLMKEALCSSETSVCKSHTA
jgi:hypothetical protein